MTVHDVKCYIEPIYSILKNAHVSRKFEIFNFESLQAPRTGWQWALMIFIGINQGMNNIRLHHISFFFQEKLKS